MDGVNPLIIYKSNDFIFFNPHLIIYVENWKIRRSPTQIKNKKNTKISW